MFGTEFSDTDWGGLIESLGAVGFSVAAVVLVGKFIMHYQQTAVTTTADQLTSTVLRNNALEHRVDDLEKKLDAEQGEHFDCRREMNKHRIESAKLIGALEAKVEVLIAQLNRPHRTTDIEKQMDGKLDDLLDHDEERDVPGLRFEPTDDDLKSEGE